MKTAVLHRRLELKFSRKKFELQCSANFFCPHTQVSTFCLTLFALACALHVVHVATNSVLFFSPAKTYSSLFSRTALSNSRSHSLHCFRNWSCSCFRPLPDRNYCCPTSFRLVIVCSLLQITLAKPTFFLSIKPTPPFISFRTSFSNFVLVPWDRHSSPVHSIYPTSTRYIQPGRNEQQTFQKHSCL